MINKKQTGKASFVLFLVKVSNISTIIEGVSPEDIVKFLQWNVEACQRITTETGGHLVRVEGHCFLLAWDQSRVKQHYVDYCDIAKQIIRKLSCQNGVAGNVGIKSPCVRVAMTRGDCIFETENDHLVRVLGGSVSRLDQIDNTCPGQINEILVDEVFREAVSHCELQPLEFGVYKISPVGY